MNLTIGKVQITIIRQQGTNSLSFETLTERLKELSVLGILVQIEY